MKENGVAYAYTAPPINEEDLADAVIAIRTLSVAD